MSPNTNIDSARSSRRCPRFRIMRGVFHVLSFLSNLKPNESATTHAIFPVNSTERFGFDKSTGRFGNYTAPSHAFFPENATENLIISTLLSTYESKTRPRGLQPSSRNGGPVVVSVNMMLRTISKIDDVNMEFSTQFTFREMWHDERLAYQNLFSWEDPGSMPEFVLLTPGDQSQQVWMPDTFFQNEKSAQRHLIDKPNIMIRIYANGDVLYSIRLSLVLSCPMSLRWYPLDKQTCVIDLASYAYTTNDILYQWKNDTPIQLKDTVKTSLPSFELVSTGTGYCTSKTATGEYSCLRVELNFQRMLSYYILQVYLPSFMLVVVSWISFWVDKSSVPARVALGITTLLTITTQASGINQKLPPVSYAKAIDIWIGICMAFVFGALIEFALVNYVAGEDSRKKQQQTDPGAPTKVQADDPPITQSMPELVVNDYGGLQITSLNHWQHKGHADHCATVSIFCIPTSKADIRRKRFYHMPLSLYDRTKAFMGHVYGGSDMPKKIDVTARFVFPISFLLFNVIYWSVYLRL